MRRGQARLPAIAYARDDPRLAAYARAMKYRRWRSCVLGFVTAWMTLRKLRR